jgi:hypothetical protein
MEEAAEQDRGPEGAAVPVSKIATAAVAAFWILQP